MRTKFDIGDKVTVLDGSCVYCTSCGAKTATYADIQVEFAMDVWNRRVTDD